MPEFENEWERRKWNILENIEQEAAQLLTELVEGYQFDAPVLLQRLYRFQEQLSSVYGPPSALSGHGPSEGKLYGAADAWSGSATSEDEYDVDDEYTDVYAY